MRRVAYRIIASEKRNSTLETKIPSHNDIYSSRTVLGLTAQMLQAVYEVLV